MSDTDPDPTAQSASRGTDAGEYSPLVRSADDCKRHPVEAADGLTKSVLVGPEEAPNFAMRRFSLAPGGEVPRHTNAVEHEQYVLSGDYVVGIGDERHRVGPGEVLLIPAGTVHWYRNGGDRPATFLCVVPDGDDAIELLE